MERFNKESDYSNFTIFDGKDDLKGLLSTKEYKAMRYKIMTSRPLWHKFIIYDSSHLPKEFLLRLILGAVSHQSDFIPVMFHCEEPDSIFYARDCGQAIEALLHLNLRIPILGTSTSSNPNKESGFKKKKLASAQQAETPVSKDTRFNYLFSQKSMDLENINATENEKIEAMIVQSTIDYDPSNYGKQKKQKKPQPGELPPMGYVCHKCNCRGHWIHDCPSFDSSMFHTKLTGIPRSLMTADQCLAYSKALEAESKKIRGSQQASSSKEPTIQSLKSEPDESEVDELTSQAANVIDALKNSVLTLRLELDTKDKVTLCPSVNKMLHSAITKRYCGTKNSLDLSNFHNDASIEPCVFFPISVNKNMSDMISVVCSNVSTICSIDLSSNCLYDIEGIRSFVHSLTQLRALDLKHNSLELSALQPLQGLLITEINLDGNPLCDKFESDAEYVSKIRSIFPELQSLDGVKLSPVGPPILEPFYLCNPAGKELVEKFIEYYFSIYDSTHRSTLYGIYHKDATLSMTCSYLAGQTTSASARLTEYTKLNRNLLRLSDYSKIDKLLVRGSKSIISAITNLPRSEHDNSTFTAELLIYTPRMSVITITGIFKEPEYHANSPRFFKRQFTLLPAKFDEYFIINELFYVSNCTTHQADSAFKAVPERAESPMKLYLEMKRSSKPRKQERKDMVKTVADLTEMNLKWSKMCLVDCMWDIRAALLYFNDNYKKGTIPCEAFVQ